MITDGYAEASESCKKESNAENLGTRQREQTEADDSQQMNQDKIEENRTFAWGRFPKRLLPGSNLLNGGLAHVTSCCVISRTRPVTTRPAESSRREDENVTTTQLKLPQAFPNRSFA